MKLPLHFIGDLSDEHGEGGEDARSNFHGQRIFLRWPRRIFVLDRQLCSELHYDTLREISCHSGMEGTPRSPRRSPPSRGRTSPPTCHDLTLTYSAYYRLADTKRSGIELPKFRLAQRRYLIGILERSMSRDYPSMIPFRLLTRGIIRGFFEVRRIGFSKNKRKIKILLLLLLIL